MDGCSLLERANVVMRDLEDWEEEFLAFKDARDAATDKVCNGGSGGSTLLGRSRVSVGAACVGSSPARVAVFVGQALLCADSYQRI